MNITEYKELYNQLNSYDDVTRLSKKYDKELLFVIFTERHVRQVKRDYYRLAGQSKRLLLEWRRGKSFCELAHYHRFSPMMMAQLILRERGMTKKEIREVLKDYNMAKEKRLKQELAVAMEKDLVYSEVGAAIQYKRGKDGEENIRRWLRARDLEFKEEAHLKKEGGKTVDFLLDKPLTVCFETHPESCREINWIESKGSFGDLPKIKRDYEKQLGPYTGLWGPGMVVYWFGFLEGMEMWLEARDVKIVRKDFFEE